MSTLEILRTQISKLHQDAPNIHMNVQIPHQKLALTDAEATIIGVYPNFFQIRETSSGFVRCHSVRYADLLTKQISVAELRSSLVLQQENT